VCLFLRSPAAHPLMLSRLTKTGVLWTTCLFLAGLCLLGADAGKEFSLKTKHYEVTTDVSPALARLVGEHMEQILAEYKRRLSNFKWEERERFKVQVFKNQRDYNRAVPAALTGSTGAFVSRTRLLATYLGERTYEEVFRTLYHEGFHQFMYLCISQDCPLWLNEGLAEYFSEATWNGKGFETGQVPPERLMVVQKALREKELLRLQRLFSMESEEWLRSMRMEKQRAYVQYCQAWSVVHFFIHSDRGRHLPKLLDYLANVASGMNVDVAFERSFGKDVNAIERAWRRYIMNLKPDGKYRCKENMRLILSLGLKLYGEPGQFESLSHLRWSLIRDNRLEWSVTSHYGTSYSSKDRKQAAALFKCPYDRSGDSTSYIMLKNPRTRLPMLFCTHHPGVVMKAYYKPRGGNYKVEVEEQVIATLPEELRRALRAKMK